MRDRLIRLLRSRVTVAFGVVGALAGGTAAFGLPWDVDMVDAWSVKAYEQPMRPLPDGVVAQMNVVSPKYFVPSYATSGPADPRIAALVSPFAEDVELGQKMYGVYCTPCHGDGIVLGVLAKPGRVPGVPLLGSDKGRAHTMTDAWIYRTIRHGSLSTIMPPYGYAMTDREMWSIVSYVRTIEGARYTPPQPESAAPTTPAGG